MKLKIFINEENPLAQQAKSLGEKLIKEGYDVEYINPDSAEATAQIEVYDIYSYPSFLVTNDDGSEIECWRGTIPLESDLKMFLNI